MTDKQPLIGGSAPAPPPYYEPSPNAPPYPPGDGGAPPYPAPGYNPLQPGYYPPPPLQPGYNPPPPQPVYGATTTNTNVTVVQAAPVAATRVLIEAKPPNNIIMSIVVLLFFCWVFGLIALIMSIQVDSTWASGDRLGARRLSASSRGWNIAGMIVGGVIYVLAIVSAIGSSTV